MKTLLVLTLSLTVVSTAMAGSIISAAEARKHIGENLGVAGYVTEIVPRSSDVIINFSTDRRPQRFSVLVPGSKIDGLGGWLFLNTLPGQFVAVSGKIRNHAGQPTIVVDQRKQFLAAQ